MSANSSDVASPDQVRQCARSRAGRKAFKGRRPIRPDRTRRHRDPRPSRRYRCRSAGVHCTAHPDEATARVLNRLSLIAPTCPAKGVVIEATSRALLLIERGARQDTGRMHHRAAPAPAVAKTRHSRLAGTASAPGRHRQGNLPRDLRSVDRLPASGRVALKPGSKCTFIVHKLHPRRISPRPTVARDVSRRPARIRRLPSPRLMTR